MSGYEEEAMNRVRQMQRRVPFDNRNAVNREAPKPSFPQPPGSPQSAPKPERPVENEKQTVPTAPSNADIQPSAEGSGDNLLGVMFRNKEQSLILLLVVLLMEEHTDPSVLLALMYLLM